VPEILEEINNLSKQHPEQPQVLDLRLRRGILMQQRTRLETRDVATLPKRSAILGSWFWNKIKLDHWDANG
jgi:hypothetical protein